MIKYSKRYLDILKNGLEDWLYVFSYCNFYFYEMVYIFDFFMFVFFLSIFFSFC